MAHTPLTIKIFLPFFCLWHCSREKKYQALPACTTSMFVLRSRGAWERGYEWFYWLRILPVPICLHIVVRSNLFSLSRFTVPLCHENSSPVKVKERISFRHQYNSRTDPNEPVRGKVIVTIDLVIIYTISVSSWVQVSKHSTMILCVHSYHRSTFTV